MPLTWPAPPSTPPASRLTAIGEPERLPGANEHGPPGTSIAPTKVVVLVPPWPMPVRTFHVDGRRDVAGGEGGGVGAGPTVSPAGCGSSARFGRFRIDALDPPSRLHRPRTRRAPWAPLSPCGRGQGRLREAAFGGHGQGEVVSSPAAVTLSWVAVTGRSLSSVAAGCRSPTWAASPGCCRRG